jgi:murein L,D-transpeptidase YafK
LDAYSPWVRTLMVSTALAVALVLAGCETDSSDFSGRALKPLSQTMLAKLERKHMTKESPILIRLFKEEAELEIWKQDDSGRFALLATYPICRWSGELGPKLKQGDRQAPEGFYTITPAQLNPNSHYYLSFDLGYPNQFDRAYGRTGSNVMVHGDCASAGCYAMTDEQISEIYALARESFFGGQRSFQVQAYPFRMTPANLAKHRDNPNMPFWQMLKEGNDHFEVTRREPKVDVCDKRYVFDAEVPADTGSVRQVSFNPIGTCPAYQVRREIAAALAEKQRKDRLQTAELVSQGTPTVPVRTGIDGGMHPVFLAKFKNAREAGDRAGTVVEARMPGTSYVDARAASPSREGTVAASTSSQASGPAASISSESGSFFSRLLRDSEEKKPESAAKLAAAPAPKAAPARPTATAAAKPNRKVERQREALAQLSQAHPRQARAEQPKIAASAETMALVSRAQPIVSTATFESRWSAIR